MRFRDLHSFNLAMFAKQGWRLLQQHESLVYNCFKAKYFLRGIFLEATYVPNSSYVWKLNQSKGKVVAGGWAMGHLFVSPRIAGFPTILHIKYSTHHMWRSGNGEYPSSLIGGLRPGTGSSLKPHFIERMQKQFFAFR